MIRLRTLNISERPAKLTGDQRREMLRQHLAGKSATLLARRYGVSESYPKVLAYYHRHGRPSRARAAA